MSRSTLIFSLTASVLLGASAYGQNSRVKDGHSAAPSAQSSPVWVRPDGDECRGGTQGVGVRILSLRLLEEGIKHFQGIPRRWKTGSI